MSWIEETHKDVSREFPPPLKIEPGKKYTITFLQPRAKVVIGAYSRKTAVIIVEHEGEKKSLYLSHVDLDRQIANLFEKLGSLEGITVGLMRKTGVTRGYRYEVSQLTPKPKSR